MQRTLIGALAVLAAAAAQAQDWGGAYAGASLGHFKATSTWTTTQLGDPATSPPFAVGETADLSANGLRYAGHAGFNWALGRSAFVGLEAGLGGSNARATLDYTPGFMDQGQRDRITATYEWDASLVGRAGFGAGPVVFYGLLGPSWQKVSLRFECAGDSGGGDSWCLTSHTENRGDVRLGWVGGAGMEWRVQRRWSARLDFRVARYKQQDYSFFGDSTAGEQVFARTTLRTRALTLGVSYLF